MKVSNLILIFFTKTTGIKFGSKFLVYTSVYADVYTKCNTYLVNQEWYKFVQLR